MKINTLFATLICALPLCLIQCVQRSRPIQGSSEMTTLPIRLEDLTSEAKDWIAASHAHDTSGYLMETRPIVMQIQGVRNGATEVRRSGEIRKEALVMVYAFGEWSGKELLDYGWLRTEGGQLIWSAEFATSRHAGGDARNRMWIDTIILPPGQFVLEYRSNAEHANPDWALGAPPERPFYYGITLFNLNAIGRIKQELQAERIPMYTEE